MRKVQMQDWRTPNKTVEAVKEERDYGRANLKNLGTNESVTMEWNLNKQAIEDQVFIMKIGDKKAYLNAEEVRRFLRWI